MGSGSLTITDLDWDPGWRDPGYIIVSVAWMSSVFKGGKLKFKGSVKKENANNLKKTEIIR